LLCEFTQEEYITIKCSEYDTLLRTIVELKARVEELEAHLNLNETVHYKE
jgi:hypothetical protein